MYMLIVILNNAIRSFYEDRYNEMLSVIRNLNIFIKNIHLTLLYAKCPRPHPNYSIPNMLTLRMSTGPSWEQLQNTMMLKQKV